MQAGDGVGGLVQDFQDEPHGGQLQPVVAIQEDGRRFDQFAAMAGGDQQADEADDAPADHGRPA